MKDILNLKLGKIGTFIKVDTCKRISRCALCERSIVKGSRRVVIDHHLTSPQKPANAKGMIYKRRVFFHPQCMSDWVLEDEKSHSSYSACFECGIPTGTTMFWTRTKRRENSPLCVDCAHSERWRWCSVCRFYSPRYHTSSIIREGIITDEYCCDDCEKDYDYLTVKVRKRLRRKERERAEG